MPVRFYLSVLSLRRSAKFALALSVAVIAVTLVTLSVRAWRTKASFASKKKGAAAQQSLAGDVNYVRRVRLQPRLRPLLDVVGDRLEKPGNERMVMAGTLTRQNDSRTAPFRLLLELPHRMRLEEQSAEPRVTSFNGGSGWASGGSLSYADQDTVETLIFDSADHFFLGQTQGLATRALGSQFRLDDGTDSNYNGPFYDVYEVMDYVRTGSEERQQPKLFYFNSNTQLLERVHYQLQRDGANVKVEIQITDWKSLNNQRVPTAITRLEDDKPVLTITITSAVIGPRMADGIFNNPQGRQ
jgi:hypothetical protein